MEYRIIEEGDKIIIKDIYDFEPKHVFECGQCFRWNEESDGSYTGVAYDRVINVKKDSNDIILSNTNIKDIEKIWKNYFDLNRDYGKIKSKLSNDKVLKEAMDFGHGIRILKQDVWETVISFIISANNRIPMIKKAIETLSEKYGEFIEEYRGKKHYSFPKPDVLSKLSIDEIEDCGVGYRAKYIATTAAIVANRQMDIYRIKNLSTDSARKELMLLSGVGPKVAHCIMLFSMDKHDSFPVDVWVKRVMEHFYFKKDTKIKDIQEYAENKFGEYSGFAQQYLFYYARENGIGRKKYN
ncbi:DNA-3-methyladenine glycosylase family protein [Caldisalinibacter kiritimatiensis]|uniref:DNA-(apurinic or apyrimidinic site) lyase n=1 Tax=Caldisalinibacter kiritimatiensis TaxID=1304284 RepID=R1AU27_9FIRM|nr:DNA glycosylase [Caldisalinibacter kiritimatiensis]EOD00172.1 Putative HhH-GPD:8-oxoguanine DNA glycosylase [Caldisalinibacter kiritimatiensis]